jgi:hypothetical protein
MSIKIIVIFAVLILIAVATFESSDSPIESSTLEEIYGSPLAQPNNEFKVYHLGHSLVGQDMPAMLKQLSGEGHDYRSQLGWGTRLEEHWDVEMPITGFESSNAGTYYQEVFEAIDSEQFDAFILTEGVEIKDSIKYHDSWKYLAKFTQYITERNPNARVFFYETWHAVTDSEGWIDRLDYDYSKYWLGGILDKALVDLNEEIPIYVIPAGQVMSALFKKIESTGGVEDLRKPQDIFAVQNDGSLDPIHLNDIGSYLVALTHYAVLYQRTPVGLPYKLKNSNGQFAVAPSSDAARLMQVIVWEVVSTDYRTGIIGFKSH